MKRYTVTHADDSTSTVTQQPGAIRKAWHWYWSALVYLVAWSLIFRGHLVWLIVALSVVCMGVERYVKLAAKAAQSVPEVDVASQYPFRAR